MTIEDWIRDEKLQYHINREAAKISALSSGFIISFDKQRKTIEDQGEKQIKAIQDNKKRIVNIDDNCKNKLSLSKEREVFENIYYERLDKIK